MKHQAAVYIEASSIFSGVVPGYENVFQYIITPAVL